MARYSKEANEPVGMWVRRIKAAQATWEKGNRDREMYREAANLEFPPLVAGSGAHELGLDVPHVDQIDVNLSRRFIDWLQSQATDDVPLITYPRDAEGDEDLAGMNERLLTRVFTEAGCTAEFRDAVTNICTQGVSALWVGIHQEVIMADDLLRQTVSTEEALREVQAGTHQPRPGQDHEHIRAGIGGLLGPPEEGAPHLSDEEHESLVTQQETHARLAAEEREGTHHPRIERGKVWCRRLPVGSWTVWSHDVWDIKDAWWMARKIVMTPAQVQEYKAFNPRVLSKLEPQALTREEGYQPIGVEIEGERPDETLEDKRYVVWEVWDKRHWTRHYVSESCPDYLEKDEKYPYYARDGSLLIPDFFPCRVIAPLMSDEELPERTFGIPLLAMMWPQQEEIIKLRSYSLAQAKRHACRMYEIPAELDEDTMAAIGSGVDGLMIRREEGVDPGKTVLPIQFHTSSQDIGKAIEDVIFEWSATSGMPASDLTSRPQADTATQELQGIQAGRQQAGDVIRQLEIGAADIVEKMRGLVRGFYADEQVFDLLGPKWIEKWESWKRTSLAGDRIQLKFAARAKAENSVRIKQMMDAYTLLRGDIDALGQPKWRTDHILAEIMRGLGVGDLTPYQPTQNELMAQAYMQQQALPTQQPGEGNGQDEGQGEGTGVPKPPGREEGPSTTGNMLAAAGRSAPNAPGPGEALS